MEGEGKADQAKSDLKPAGEKVRTPSIAPDLIEWGGEPSAEYRW
jgi:hypothetical protein